MHHKRSGSKTKLDPRRTHLAEEDTRAVRRQQLLRARLIERHLGGLVVEEQAALLGHRREREHVARLWVDAQVFPVAHFGPVEVGVEQQHAREELWRVELGQRHLQPQRPTEVYQGVVPKTRIEPEPK